MADRLHRTRRRRQPWRCQHARRQSSAGCSDERDPDRPDRAPDDRAGAARPSALRASRLTAGVSDSIPIPTPTLTLTRDLARNLGEAREPSPRDPSPGGHADPAFRRRGACRSPDAGRAPRGSSGRRPHDDRARTPGPLAVRDRHALLSRSALGDAGSPPRTRRGVDSCRTPAGSASEALYRRRQSDPHKQRHASVCHARVIGGRQHHAARRAGPAHHEALRGCRLLAGVLRSHRARGCAPGDASHPGRWRRGWTDGDARTPGRSPRRVERHRPRRVEDHWAAAKPRTEQHHG